MPPTLLAVPNVSEGRRPSVIDAIANAFGDGLLDVHSDTDHHRTVFTAAGRPGTLADTVLSAARVAIERIDLTAHEGIHPRIGVVDIAPIVFLEPADRGAAQAEALVLGDGLSDELGLPVFLYGDLGRGRTRAELRRGGPDELARRMAAGELTPDFGPRAFDPHRGAVLLAARPPLVAFNLELAPPAALADAQRIAAEIRATADGGLPGVRAIGLMLEAGGLIQVSTNLEDHQATSPAELLAAVERRAPVAAAELVGLAPEAAFDGWPERIPVRNRRTIEQRLGH
jgi:glutamate formiminotransferase